MGIFDWLFGGRSRTAAAAPAPRPAPAPRARAAAAPAFAVIDVETTGLSPKRDRVLELAIVRLDRNGATVDEWSTRFDPEGPVGATHIHGIRQEDVDGAPLFRDLAPTIVQGLNGLPVVAHNARFDLAFMRAEFDSAGWDLPFVPAYCTLSGSQHYFPRLERRRLADCCSAARVRLDDAHSALGDARATAGLLQTYMRARRQDPELVAAPQAAASVRWPTAPSSAARKRTRPSVSTAGAGRRWTSTPKPAVPLVQQIRSLSLTQLLGSRPKPSTTAYLETLLDALEDGQVTSAEDEALRELAGAYDLDASSVTRIREGVLRALAFKAVEDGKVSSDERTEITAAAELLGTGDSSISSLLKDAERELYRLRSARLAPLPQDWSSGEPLRVGDSVVFTGCDVAMRERLERATIKAGVKVASGVSGKTTMLITDADATEPLSGKHRAALERGTRIVHPTSYATLLQHVQPHPSAVSDAPPMRSAPTAHGSGATGTASPSEIRAWAAEQGIEVGVRGRIAADVVAAYERAHASADEPV